MNGAAVWIDFATMEQFVTDVFKGIGVPENEAGTCTDVLAMADKFGIDSHGIGRLKPIYYDRIVHQKIQEAVTRFEIVKDNMATAVVDGHHGMGMVISQRCMQMAIDKARKYGMGMVVARNSTHYGIAGYYARMACDAGMIGITGTNARPSIAPTFGIDNMLGTNPLVFGMPTDEPFDFVNDYATSISQRGKVELAEREGKDLPQGLIIDRNGNYMVNPSQILKALDTDQAALLPIGGALEETGSHKGYGFATVVEILSASLQQGAFLRQLCGIDAEGKKRPYSLGHFFIAINVESFTELASFKKATGELLRELRNSTKAPGAERIYTCGEKEYLTWQERKNKGVPVNSVLQKQMIAMRNELGLKKHKFIFE